MGCSDRNAYKGGFKLQEWILRDRLTKADEWLIVDLGLQEEVLREMFENELSENLCLF